MLADLDYLNSRSSQENNRALTCVEDPYEACKDSHAIAIITEWDEFKSFDWESIYKSVVKPAKVFDGRNILDGEQLKDLGFDVYSIGK